MTDYETYCSTGVGHHDLLNAQYDVDQYYDKITRNVWMVVEEYTARGASTGLLTGGPTKV